MSLHLTEEQVSRICDILDQVKALHEEEGRILASGITSKPMTSKDIDVSRIVFKVKGGTDAGANNGWAWARAQDGSYHPESKDLVQALEQYGEVKQGAFTYSLSKDGKFLNRKRPK